MFNSLAPADCHMRREQGGPSLSPYWSARAGGAVGNHHWAVSAAFEHLHCTGAGKVFDLSGWGDFSGGEAGGTEARGDWAVGEAAEGGEGSAVDGKPAGARVGQEGKVSRDGITVFQFLYLSPLLYHYLAVAETYQLSVTLTINVSRRIFAIFSNF